MKGCLPGLSLKAIGCYISLQYVGTLYVYYHLTCKNIVSTVIVQISLQKKYQQPLSLVIEIESMLNV